LAGRGLQRAAALTDSLQYVEFEVNKHPNPVGSTRYVRFS
jgi:hypothetical protein